MKHSIQTLIIAAMMVCCAFMILPSDDSEAYSETEDFLLDYGNGKTEWIKTYPADSVVNTVRNTLINNGHEITGTDANLKIDGIGTNTIGDSDTGGSLSVSGTTGTMVTSKWRYFVWNSDKWEESLPQKLYSSQNIAVGHYPENVVPVETPDCKSSWTMVLGDSENSSNQTAVISNEDISTKWSFNPITTANALYGSMLYVQGHSIVKYGHAAKGGVSVVSYDTESGNLEWTFKYPTSTGMETTTELIVGNYVYVQCSNGMIYKFDWRTGPGTDNADVTTFDGKVWTDTSAAIPGTTAEVIGLAWGSGPTSMVYDSGCIFLKSSNGMIYCFNTNLELIWSYQTNGNTYYSAPTVYGSYVFAGMYDGVMYALEKNTGKKVAEELVYQTTYSSKPTGCANPPAVIEDGSDLYLFTTFNDGRGMSAKVFGIAIYKFNGTSFEKIAYHQDELGALTTYLCKSQTLKGVFFNSGTGTYFMSLDGKYTLINDITANESTRTSPTLVNDKYLFFSTYESNTLYQLNIDGTVLGSVKTPIKQYSMSQVVVVDNYIFGGNDAGAYCLSGTFDPYVPPAPPAKEEAPIVTAAKVLGVIIVALSATWAIMKFGLKWDKPFAHIKNAIYVYFYGENYTHNKRSKHRLWAVLLVGLMITLVLSIMSLCIGSETTLSPYEALHSMFTSIHKGGRGLTYEEMLIYNSRLPRTIVAFAVGVGLSIAGAVYQAIIKNPLVEPYIMGVSSGAGTMAVAVMAYNFTLFGLLSPDNVFLIAISAILGGLLAFALTMILAIKTGGKSTNYVLSGIVIGLVFSAIQSLLMIMAGKNVASALSWLYGSFSTISWEKVWLVLVPVLFLSLVPLVWSKELNLVLLGDDQAKLMGLNVDRFNKFMLILASILTAFCVAFCGIIGFVGLVIPHLCRMILGGDHRLMLPASMAFGGFLMIAADLIARGALPGYELPVGAVTTIIGVPVFAYLLIKRGKSYDM